MKKTALGMVLGLFGGVLSAFAEETWLNYRLPTVVYVGAEGKIQLAGSE